MPLRGVNCVWRRSGSTGDRGWGGWGGGRGADGNVSIMASGNVYERRYELFVAAFDVEDRGNGAAQWLTQCLQCTLSIECH